MRIGFISYEFPPEIIGGIGTYVRHAVEMLMSCGHEVTVIAGTRGKPRIELHAGATIQRLPCHDRMQFATVARPALVAAHATQRFDVIEVPDLYAEGAGLREQLPHVPIVLRAHTPLYIPRQIDFLGFSRTARTVSAVRRMIGGLRHPATLRRAWCEARARFSWRRAYSSSTDPERAVALEADLVVSPSRRLAQRLQYDWALPLDKVRVLPYPHVPSPALLALSPGTTGHTVAFHGGVRYFKGVHVLVAAIPAILAAHPATHFVLAGPTGASPTGQLSWRAIRDDAVCVWRDTVEWLDPAIAPFRDRVNFSGFIPPERLDQHLRVATVCVFPSLFDNFPNACLEAMCAARAIVATRSGGMEEMLGADEAGLLVPPGNAPALAAAINRLLADPGLRERLGRNARERILTRYAPAVIAPRHEALYAEAGERRRLSSAA